MDPFELPENLTELSDSELEDLRADIAGRIEDLSQTEDLTDDVVETVEALVEAARAVSGESTRREDAATARRARLDEALRSVSDDPVDGDALLEEGADLVDPAGAPAEDVAAAAAGAVSLADAAAEPVSGDPPAAPAAPAAAAAPVAAAARPAAQPRRGGPGSLRRPSGSAPRTRAGGTEGRPAFQMTGPDMRPIPSVKALAERLAKARWSMGDVPQGTTGDKVYMAIGQKTGIEHEITRDDAERNFETIRNAQVASKAIVASGSSCAPFTPMYDFYRLAEPQSPLEDALGTVGAPRGGVRYIKSPDYTQALGAIGVNTLPKPKATVSCPEIADQAVEPVTQIVQFDNLQYKVFPEQVEAFLEDVAVIFAQKKEVVYLTAIDGVSTPVSSAIPYGAARGLIYDLMTAAVAFRKRHGMKRGSPLEVLLPDWSLDLYKLDLAQDGNEGLQFMGIPDAKVLDVLDQIGLVPVWLNDGPTGDTFNQKFNLAQAAGGLNGWPIEVVSYIHGIGSNLRLDGGTLDVGIVRDSTLNGTNDLQMFMEEWVGVIELPPEQIKLISTVCPSGARPDYVNPFTCPAPT